MKKHRARRQVIGTACRLLHDPLYMGRLLRPGPAAEPPAALSLAAAGASDTAIGDGWRAGRPAAPMPSATPGRPGPGPRPSVD